MKEKKGRQGKTYKSSKKMHGGKAQKNAREHNCIHWTRKKGERAYRRTGEAKKRRIREETRGEARSNGKRVQRRECVQTFFVLCTSILQPVSSSLAHLSHGWYACSSPFSEVYKQGYFCQVISLSPLLRLFSHHFRTKRSSLHIHSSFSSMFN